MANKLDMRMDLRGLDDLQRKSPASFKIAAEKGGIQFLNWANNGSAGTSKKPPIRWGVLRGSSSAFLGAKLIAIHKQAIRTGAKEEVTPATSNHNGKSTSGGSKVLTFAWNTDYAAKMHEWKGSWGQFTVDDGDAGAKWLEEHLQKDKDDLYSFIRNTFQKEVGIK